MEREGEVRDDAKGLGGVLGFQGMAKGGWLDLVHQVEAVWANSSPMHATCSIKWPHEKYFQILSNQKLGETPIIFDTPPYHLFEKRN